MMIYNKLPHTDLSVSRICLGTMTFGEQNTELEAHQQLDFAYDRGVNFLDTAELYAVPSTKDNNGLTEQYIGTWLSQKGNRHKYYIATKVTGPSRNMPYISDNLGFSKGRIIEAVEQSLSRLQIDCIDLYQLHWPERNANFFGKLGYQHNPDEAWTDNIGEVVNTLQQLVEDGKIRYWGLSNETPWGTMRFGAEASANNAVGPITVQNPYSLLNRTYEVGMAEISMRENIGLLAYSPLGMGMLSGKYHNGKDTATDRLNKYKYFSRYIGQHIHEVTKLYLDVANKFGVSLTQMALAFVNQQPFLSANIIGATSIAQLSENIDSIDLQLSNEILKEIELVHNENPNPAP